MTDTPETPETDEENEPQRMQFDGPSVSITDELKTSYLDYAMSVIVNNAIPDLRDGLKPVHRRILYAMHETGNSHDKAYRKSARPVGDVMGKYHPMVMARFMTRWCVWRRIFRCPCPCWMVKVTLVR